MELLIAKNPDDESTLPCLLRVPLDDGLVFRCKDTWPRTSAIYCHPVAADEWTSEIEIVERVELRSCVRRGAAIEIVASRSRENRSQIIYTKARGRDVVFWQSPKTRKKSRPNSARPTGIASGVSNVEIVIDANERYAYKFGGKPVTTSKQRLVCGDYAVFDNENMLGVVERKSIDDLSSSVLSGRLGSQMTELSLQRRSAVVVENSYPDVFKTSFGSPSKLADGIAELQVRWPTVPIIFCTTRGFAEEWTYRFLAAAFTWVE